MDVKIRTISRSFVKIIFLIVAFQIINYLNCNGQVERINLIEPFEKKERIDLSEIAVSIEYVKLETHPNYRCGPQVRVYCTDKYIVTVSINNIFLFDRETGAFLTEIGKSTQIYSTFYVIPFDEQRNIITLKSESNTVAEFSLMSNSTREMKLPAEHGNSVYWKEGIYIQFVPNIIGDDKRRLIFFTKDSTIIKVYPNKNKYSKTAKSNFISNKEGGFHWFNRNLYFKETFIDTIYQITEEKLIPKYCFEEGSYGLDYSMKGTLDLRDKQKYFFISNIYETDNYLFFNIEYGLKVYSGIYFKKEDSCKISDYCLANRTGFANDLDHFLPLHFSSVNNSVELIGFCIPGEIKKWKKTYTTKISDKEKLSILEVHDDDNPVVIIAKLKCQP